MEVVCENAAIFITTSQESWYLSDVILGTIYGFLYLLNLGLIVDPYYLLSDVVNHNNDMMDSFSGFILHSSLVSQ